MQTYAANLVALLDAEPTRDAVSICKRVFKGIVRMNFSTCLSTVFPLITKENLAVRMLLSH